MKQICITVSNVDKVIAFEWIVEGLSNKYNFIFILIGKKRSYLNSYLREKGIETYEIEYRGKRDAPKVVSKIFFYLRKKKIDVIHTHLVEATLFSLLPAKLLGIKKRIYTRHHSDYNYKYSPKGIKYDKISNWLATDIIAITEQVRNILVEKERVAPKKITLVHHGRDINYFENFELEKVQKLSDKYNPGNKGPVIGVIARQTHWKGIQYTIPAFAEILKYYPDALLLLANAHGDYEPTIDSLLKQFLPENSFVKVKYEYDISSLYQLLDVLVHVPIDEVVEAFGQVYIEALAAGVPCVFTLSGIALDFIKDGQNAIVVPYCDSPSIVKAILRILQEDEFRSMLIKNGKHSVQEKFGLDTFLGNLSDIYEKP
ncbi:MAG: glycosyltransferase family 4 protein [Chitinophagaceae bacterium]|nr:glycosyltransferase family 4 protein [Chitinophagaceae bacterium]